MESAAGWHREKTRKSCFLQVSAENINMESQHLVSARCVFTFSAQISLASVGIIVEEEDAIIATLPLPCGVTAQR